MKYKLPFATALFFSLAILLSQYSFSQACPPPDKAQKKLAQEFSAKINFADTCEAYPFLSSDGLRLYFTTDRESGFGRLYFCSRKSVNENFGEPGPLSVKLTDGYYAATLTADELTLYCCKNGEIYKTTRKSLNDNFKEPQVVNGFAEGWKFAPAISPDGNEIMIILGEEKKDEAIHYRKNTKGVFEETDRLKPVEETELDPGQFSKDGLSFYMSYEKGHTPEYDADAPIQQIIVRYKRNSTSDKFIFAEEVEALNIDRRNHQPTMNADETIFIVVNTDKDVWSENDLRMIQVDEKDFVKTSDEPKTALFTDFTTYSQDYRLKEITSMLNAFVLVTDLRCAGSQIKEIVMVDTVVSDISKINTAKSDLVVEPAKVKIYPNPFIDNIVISLPNENKNFNFELLDISGKKIMSTRLNSITSRLQLNKAVSGLFVYRITSDSGKLISSGKLVKK